jgi:hypothetical protein
MEPLGAGFRCNGREVRARAAHLGIKTSNRALASYAHVNRKTMDRVLGNLRVYQPTVDLIMAAFGLPGEDQSALFTPIPLNDAD